MPETYRLAEAFRSQDRGSQLIRNIGNRTVGLSGMRLAGGIDFEFDLSGIPSLAPGEFVLVVRNAEAFALRYGDGYPIAGEYERNLSNGGEELRLLDASGKTILGFRYNDGGLWPASTDGGGQSLELRDPATTPADAYANPSSWRPSAKPGGSPGAPGGASLGRESRWLLF